MAGDMAIRAARPGARIRRPKQSTTGRICLADECNTLISRYNRSDTCFRHRPVTYPRIRGQFAEDTASN
jgi:hypothetical protein